MQQVSSKLHKHTNRKQKNKHTHMLLEETAAPKWERATKRTPRTRNVNTAPSTPNTLEDTHLARKNSRALWFQQYTIQYFFFGRHVHPSTKLLQRNIPLNKTQQATRRRVHEQQELKKLPTQKADSRSKTDSAKESEEAMRKRRQQKQRERTHDRRLMTLKISLFFCVCVCVLGSQKIKK